MVRDQITAKRISDSMWEVLHSIQECLAAVEEACSHEEYVAFRKAVGEVVKPVMFGVLEPLYKDHPSLKPSTWD